MMRRSRFRQPRWLGHAAAIGLGVVLVTSCDSPQAPSWRETISNDLTATTLFPASAPPDLGFVFINQDGGREISAFIGVNSPAVRICGDTAAACSNLEGLNQHELLREGTRGDQPFSLYVLDAGLELEPEALAFWTQTDLATDPDWLDQPALSSDSES